MVPTKLPRRTATMPPELADALDELAESRFGGKVSSAVRASVEMALVVYADPSTFRAKDGREALSEFVRGRGGVMPDDA